MAEGPITKLQAVRQLLGWKQSRVLAAVAAQAKSAGFRVAGPASLKTMLSRWENGNGRPDPVYQGLLCRIYDCDPDELGFPNGADTRPLLVPPVADEEAVDYFRSVLA